MVLHSNLTDKFFSGAYFLLLDFWKFSNGSKKLEVKFGLRGRHSDCVVLITFSSDVSEESRHCIGGGVQAIERG